MTTQDGKRLLVVEDERLLLRLVSQFLRNEGYDVVEAADGREGVDLYERRRPFDVVLLDLNLPYIPGEEVCRRIKAINPFQAVVICSAAVLDQHLDVLDALGVNQFLGKPYHPRALLERIRSGAQPEASSIEADPHRPLAPVHRLVKPRQIG